MSDIAQDGIHTMPCGGTLWVERPRSAGPLGFSEVTFCQAQDIPLAYDAVQSGWVPAAVHDDLALVDTVPLGRYTKAPHIAPQFQLRAWRSTDLDAFVALLDDSAVWENMPEPYPAPLTRDLAANLIEVSNASNHHQVHAVLHQGLPVGQVRLLFDLDDTDPGVAEVSYWFGRAHWGKGLASAAVNNFVRQCFGENPDLTALVARVKDGNAASFRVLEKAGFAADGADPAPGWQALRKARDTTSR